MTIAKLNTKTVAVAVALGLALSVALGFSVQSAGAQSMNLTQLVDLFIQLGIIAPDKAAAAKAAVTSSGSASMTYTRDLTVGSSGADVTALQTQLGVTPATGYFGSITKAAVAQYQAANGLPATGYFGPLTRAKLNGSAVVTTPSTPSTPSTMTGSGEGYLDDIEQLSRLSSEEVGEGEEDVEVLGVEVTAEDADQQIDRVIVQINTPSDANNDDLEDLVSDVSIWLDGELLGRMDVEDASYDRSDDEYTFRFTGLDGVVKEGDTVDLVVAVSGVNNIDDADSGDGWKVVLPADAIRAVSPNGVDDFYGTLTDETFTVETFASANDIELSVSKDSSSPDAMSVEVDDSDETDGVEILVFELEAEGSDIEVLDLPILLTISSTTSQVDNVVNSLTLEIDGEEYSETVTSTSTDGTTVVTFDDLDLVIDEGDSVVVTVKADINDLENGPASSGFYAGTTLKAELTAAIVDTIEAEDQTGEDIGAADLTGTALGEEIGFYADGITVEFVSATETISDVSDSDTNSRGTYVIKFDVTAFGEDAYVDSQSGTSTDGVQWEVTGDSFTGGASSNLSSTGEDNDDNFLVEDGDTETFTLTVVLTNTLGTPGFYGINVTEIGIGSADDATAETTITTGIDDLETDEVNLQ